MINKVNSIHTKKRDNMSTVQDARSLYKNNKTKWTTYKDSGEGYEEYKSGKLPCVNDYFKWGDVRAKKQITLRHIKSWALRQVTYGNAVDFFAGVIILQGIR